MDDAGSTATITRGEAALRSFGLTTEKDLESSQSLIPATVTVNLKRLLETGDPSLNVEVFPGDRVTVPRAGIVYVVGAVTRSGGFPMTSAREEMTVLKALALAGDVTSTAKKKKAMIIRKTPALPGGREEIPVDLNAVLAGSSPDRALQANDILFVPDSGSKRALRRAADAAVQVGTGVVIYRR
jgi:polysaccharide export outer membrane protein